MVLFIYTSLSLLLVALIAALLAEHSEGAFTSQVNNNPQTRKPLPRSAGHQPSTTYLFLASENSDEASSSTPSVVKSSESTSSSVSTTSDASSPLDGIQNDLQMRLRIFQESNEKGFSLKQILANVIAGEYDQEATKAKLQELITSAPCVMFTWERSPSCVKAVEALDAIMGISSDQMKIVRLDDPWSEGNPMRAELGKMVGRSSVPFVFIDGKYVGGFDGGTSEEAPGIQTMAFQGTLRPTLEAAGISFSNDNA